MRSRCSYGVVASYVAHEPASSAQPCRCLCRGFSQITITRPCRRITLHLSQIFLTLGWTFIELLLSDLQAGGGYDSLVSVDDAAAREVIGGELDDDPVGREDADVVLPHLATDGGQHLVSVGQLHAEHRVRQGLDHGALQLEGALFLRQFSLNLFCAYEC